MKPLVLEPIPDYTIWGGDTISTFRNADKNYGTWWEVSAHPYCTNKIKGEEKTLQQYIDEDPEKMLGKGLDLHEMLRVAFLDAKYQLSIQVHPYDTYAQEHNHDYGKDESWYIIQAKPGAKLVAGTKTKDPDQIKKALEEQTIEDLLNYVEVKQGDYIDIPCGMLHALGSGIVALEVGTNSNTTYRFYDYHRKDSQGKERPLHLKESFDVADFSKKPTFVPAKKETRRIGDTENYTVDEVFVKETPLKLETNGRYLLISNLGEETILYTDGNETRLGKWESAFIPAALSCVTINKNAHVLVSRTKGNKK